MFTGLVDDIGIIERVAEEAAGRALRVRCRYRDLMVGESIACNGACLTVREQNVGWFTAAAVGTTLSRTTIGAWQPGTRINLERSVRPLDRLGGHLVQGHVDGVAVVDDVRTEAASRLVRVALPAELMDVVVPHGAIAVDGVSLTVNDVPAPAVVELSIIDYTLRHTTLGALEPGARVHVEGDVIGKYVHRMLSAYVSGARS